MASRYAVVGVVLSIGIIVALVLVGTNLLSAVAEDMLNTYPDATAVIQISGNDVVVTLVGAGDLSDVSLITIYLDMNRDTGYQFTNIMYESPYICKDMAMGVRGSKTVIVEGHYVDGSVGIIDYRMLEFI